MNSNVYFEKHSLFVTRFDVLTSLLGSFVIMSGFKLSPIGCTVRDCACAGPYMFSLANVCHFVAGRSLSYVKED